MGVAAYALLLRLYPGSFRREWAGAMLRLFARRGVERLRRGGMPALATWWVRSGADLARSLAAEWAERWREERIGAPRPGSLDDDGGSTMGERIGELFADVVRAVRGFRRTPLWTVTALATLVVGTGAVTGMFSLVHDMLVRPLPFRDPEALVSVTSEPVRGEARRFSLPLLETWQAEDPGGVAAAGYSLTSAPLGFADGPEYVSAGYATGNLMELLGVRPMLGRPFEEADGREGAPPVLALAEELWRSRFGADPGIVGRTVVIGSRTFTVVAVIGPELRILLPEARLWISTATFPRSPYITVFSAVGRLPAGTSLEAARARLEAVRVSDTAGSTFSGRAEPLRDALVGDTRPVLMTFLAVVAGLLLIAAVNLANLLLGRAVAHSDDQGIRRALGATRLRLLRGAAVQALLLGFPGGAAGLLLGVWFRRLVVAWSPDPIPGLGARGPGWPAAAFALAVAVVLSVVLSVWATAAAASALPAVQAGASRRSGGRRSSRAQRTLSVVQVAATFVLLTASTLLTLTFRRLSSVDPGFDTAETGGVLYTLPTGVYTEAGTQADFARRLVERLEALPGVERAAVADRAPLKGLARSRVAVEGVDSAALPEEPAAVLDLGPGFLQVLGVPLVRGRPIRPSDVPGEPRVTLVNEAFVRAYLPPGDPLGRRIRLGGGDWRTVVGVVGDLRLLGPDHPAEPAVLEPIDQSGSWSTFQTVVFRTRGRAADQLPAVRAALRELEPRAPVLDLGGYERWLRASPGFAEARFRALVVGVLGAVSLLLALVGVYGVTAYSVRVRTRELGIRIALGASRLRVLNRVLAEGLMLAAAGVALGAPVAWLLLSALERFLEGAPARDPGAFAAVAAGLAAVALLASVWPAVGASRLEPVEVLRDE